MSDFKTQTPEIAPLDITSNTEEPTMDPGLPKGFVTLVSDTDDSIRSEIINRLQETITNEESLSTFSPGIISNRDLQTLYSNYRKITRCPTDTACTFASNAGGMTTYHYVKLDLRSAFGEINCDTLLGSSHIHDIIVVEMWMGQQITNIYGISYMYIDNSHIPHQILRDIMVIAEMVRDAENCIKELKNKLSTKVYLENADKVNISTLEKNLDELKIHLVEHAVSMV